MFRVRVVSLVIASTALLASITIAGATAGPQHAQAVPAISSDLQAEMDATAEQRAAALQAERSTPAAKRERTQSRTAYQGESPREARQLAETTFPGVATDSGDERSADRPHIDRYLGPRAALVSDEQHTQKSVVESTLPLRAPDASGKLEPVSLTLERSDAAFRPQNGLAKISIGAQADKGIAFTTSAFSVRPVGAAPSDGELSDNRVFFGSIYPDTDMFVAPLPTGAETFLQLRSADSPEEASLAFDLPAGVHLHELKVPTPFGSEQLVQSELVVGGPHGRLAEILPPSAYDADGVSVPVEWNATGDRLNLVVRHRDGDFRYPILVDPTVLEDYAYWTFQASATGEYDSSIPFTGWQYGQNPAPTGSNVNYFYHPTSDTTYHPQEPSSNYGNGLYVLGWGNSQYHDGEWGEWIWQAPGDAFIYRAEFGYVIHDPNSTSLVEGVWSGQTNSWEPATWTEPNGVKGTNASPWSTPDPQHYNYKVFCLHDTCSPQAVVSGQTVQNGHSGNLAAIGLTINGTFGRVNPSQIFLGGAKIYVHDFVPPIIDSVSHSGLPAGWVRDATPSVTLTAHDGGLGLKSFVVSSPNSATFGITVTSSCTGSTPANRACPSSNSLTLPYDTSSLPEGVNTVEVRATDITDNATTPSTSAGTAWPIKIDRTGPSISLSGALKDAENAWVGGTRALNIHTTDAGSGVASVEVQVDGTRRQINQLSCSPTVQCPSPLDDSYTLNTANFAPGDHVVTVIATDAVGNSTTSTPFHVKTDDEAPDTSVGGSLLDHNGLTLSDGSYGLSIDAADGDADLDESGVTKILVSVDGNVVYAPTQVCPGDSCEMDQDWSFEPSSYSEGQHTITVSSVDGAGNVDSTLDPIVVSVLHAKPSETKDASVDDSARIDGALTGDRAGQSVASLGDVNGDGIGDYAVGESDYSPIGRPGDGDVAVLYGGSLANIDLLSSLGTRGFHIKGAGLGAHAGAAVVPAGDVNGDGLADILVGVPYAPTQGGASTGAGKVFVVFGSSSPLDVDLAALGSRGFEITGTSTPLIPLDPANPAHAFGATLSGPIPGPLGTSSDVNGDGLSDVIVGAPGDSPSGRSEAGSAYVIFGKADTTTVNVSALGTHGFRIDGPLTGGHLGNAAAIVGDVNSDGLDDIAVTVPGVLVSGRSTTGTAVVIYSDGSSANVDLASLSSSRGYWIYGASGDGLGSSIAPVGDVNGDNLADFAIGGQGAYTVFGSETGLPTDLAQNTGNAIRYNPPSGTGWDHSVVAGAGDLNGDEYPDLLIGFPNASDNRSGQGIAYAVFNEPLSTATVDLSNLAGQWGTRIIGAGSDLLGTGMAAIPDAGNGQPAVLIGAPTASGATKVQSGSAYVFRTNAFAAGVGPATASGPASRTSDNCYVYSDKTPYAYHNLWDVPTCRVTQTGAMETSPRGHFDANLVLKDRGGRTTHRRVLNSGIWPVKDSSGKTFAGIRETSLHKWTVYKPTAFDASGNATAYSAWAVPYDDASTAGVQESRPQLKLQGRACMTTKTLHDNYALVAFSSFPISTVSNGTGESGAGQDPSTGAWRDIALRGFIADSALATDVIRRSNHADKYQDTNSNVIDKYDITCGKALGKGAAIGTATRGKPIFDQTGSGPLTADAHPERYQGPSLTRCDEFNKYCGFQYWNYSRPSLDPNEAYLSASSTGIRRGGVIRGIIDVTKAFAIRDQINYVDPNVPCDRYKVAQWYFGNANPTPPYSRTNRAVWGWLAQRIAPTASNIRDYTNDNNCRGPQP